MDVAGSNVREGGGSHYRCQPGQKGISPAPQETVSFDSGFFVFRCANFTPDLDDHSVEVAHGQHPEKTSGWANIACGDPVAGAGEKKNERRDDHVRQHVEKRMPLEPPWDEELLAHQEQVCPGNDEKR